MVYEDEISSNKGDFVIPNVNLISPYACVEVRGLYRNEMTGEYSGDSISLFALTDLKTAVTDSKDEARNKVNVNLLTHLEYKRALYLVSKGYSVYAAKKQADQEIMTAFELPTTVKYSEDLSVFEDSEDDNVDYANASLMMLNLLFLGNRTDAEIMIAINKFITDIEQDGSWEDDSTKAYMADFAYEVDADEIRANVKSWNILDIPAFEDQLDMFWNNVYGLGGCSDKRKAVVAPNANNLSRYYKKYFICNGAVWDSATTYQKDTYEWESGKTGGFKKGNVTDTIYTYNGTAWTVAERETTIGLCTSYKAGKVSLFNGTYYTCENGAWRTSTVLEYDTYGWEAGAEGDVNAGTVNTGKYYVYENGAWRASSSEIENNLGACVTSRQGEVGKSGSSYYICRSKNWTTATVLEYDTYGLTGVEGAVKAGVVNTEMYYVYENGAWRASTSEIENNLGACVTSREGEVGKSGSTYYICNYCSANGWVSLPEGWSWDVPKEVRLNPDIEYGTMTDTRDGQTYKTVVIGEQVWMAENLNYGDSVSSPSLKGKSRCYENNEKYCAVTGRLYTWAAAIDSVALAKDADNPQICGYGVTCTLPDTVLGICPDGWHLPSWVEWNSLITAVGGEDNAGKALKSTSGWISNGNGTDAYGFSALPAGSSYDGGGFNNAGYHAYFWSSAEDDSDNADYMALDDTYDGAGLYYGDKYNGFSVRCLKNSN